jgi:hypothetical protein
MVFQTREGNGIPKSSIRKPNYAIFRYYVVGCNLILEEGGGLKKPYFISIRTKGLSLGMDRFWPGMFVLQ